MKESILTTISAALEIDRNLLSITIVSDSSRRLLASVSVQVAAVVRDSSAAQAIASQTDQVEGAARVAAVGAGHVDVTVAATASVVPVPSTPPSGGGDGSSSDPLPATSTIPAVLVDVIRGTKKKGAFVGYLRVSLQTRASEGENQLEYRLTDWNLPGQLSCPSQCCNGSTTAGLTIVRSTKLVAVQCKNASGTTEQGPTTIEKYLVVEGPAVETTFSVVGCQQSCFSDQSQSRIVEVVAVAMGIEVERVQLVTYTPSRRASVYEVVMQAVCMSNSEANELAKRARASESSIVQALQILLNAQVTGISIAVINASSSSQQLIVGLACGIGGVLLLGGALWYGCSHRNRNDKDPLWGDKGYFEHRSWERNKWPEHAYGDASLVFQVTQPEAPQIQEAPQYFLNEAYDPHHPMNYINSYEFEEQVQSRRDDTGPVLYAVSPVPFQQFPFDPQERFSPEPNPVNSRQTFKPLYSLPYAPASSVSPEDYPLSDETFYESRFASEGHYFPT